MLLTALLTSSAVAGEPGEALTAGALTVEAAEISLDGDVVTAAGTVTAEWEGLLLTAESITFRQGAGELSVGEGALAAHGLSFEAATLRLDGEVPTGTLSGARLDRPGAHLTAASLEWQGERLTFTDGRFTPCGCEVPIWSLEAKRGSVDPAGWATVSGAWLRLGERRLLPVPWAAVPVGRVVHPLPPRVGWTDDGLTLGVPVWLPLGRRSALAVGPEWRQLRGWRAMGEADITGDQGGGVLSGAIGWDTDEGALRGMAGADVGRAAPGLWRLAATGQWTSDADYLSDFGDSLLARSAPWLEQRALAGIGPARAELFVWQDRPDNGARPSLVVERPVQPLGPARGSAYGRLDVVDGDARAEPSLRLDHSGDLGPVEVNTGLVGRVIGYGGAVPSSAADGAALGTVLLPMWADHGGWRHELLLGGGGSVAGRGGGVLERLPTDAAWTPWSAGPLVESRWWGAKAGVVLSAGAPVEASGPGWTGRARGSAGPWSLMLQSDGRLEDEAVSGLSGGRVGYGDEVWDLWIGGWTLRAEDGLYQGRAGGAVGLPGEAGRWRPEVEVIATPEALQEGRVGLGWSSYCDCLTVTGRAALAEDRRWPQLGVELQLLN